MNPFPLLPTVFAIVATAGTLCTQCPSPSTWVPGGTCPAPDGTVWTMVRWDPDGAGPLGVHVACGGEFRYAGALAAANVALYDPVARSWSPLGAGFDAPVRALVVTANGELVAGGAFLQSGGTPVARVARWTGAAWAPLGSGTSGEVWALALLPAGDLIAGGAFASAGGVAASNIARWDGAVWLALGAGLSMPVFPPQTATVMGLGVRSNGDVIAGGRFTVAGGVPVNGLAKWNGAAWSDMGFPAAAPIFTTLVVLANDDVLVSSGDVQSNHFVNRWDGVTWSVMGAFPSPLGYTALCELANGTLLAQRLDSFSALGELLQWSGSAWMPVATQTLFGTATAILEVAANDVLLAGSLHTREALTMRRWNGVAWQAPAAGLDGWVADVEAVDDRIVVVGWFTQVGDVAATGVAVRTNGTWNALGGGVDGNVNVVHRAANGMCWLAVGSRRRAACPRTTSRAGTA